jgi:hypothetical protein
MKQRTFKEVLQINKYIIARARNAVGTKHFKFWFDKSILTEAIFKEKIIELKTHHAIN